MSNYDYVWASGGRFFDALRPSVEPAGLLLAGNVEEHRRQHLQRVRVMFRSASVFIFTFGLTETWERRDDRTVYPTAPGTIAGDYSSDLYAFRNFSYEETFDDFLKFRDIVRSINPKMRFIITVSPVPLTATASSNHVITATTQSKAVLRAVAGKLYENYDDIDYFPSYEIVAGFQSRGVLYENNMRNVSRVGVDIVMGHFMRQHVLDPVEVAPQPNNGRSGEIKSHDSERVYCEEELLQRFGR